nr:formin-binding protein 4-like [Onthophagus taurus]
MSLISYGSSSESENECDKDDDKKESVEDKSSIKENESEPSDFDDELDILTQIQKKANDLKKIGGEVPTEVKKLIETTSNSPKIGVSLVPGYGDDSEDELETTPNVLETKTLFPAAKNIENSSNSNSNDANHVEFNTIIDKSSTEKKFNDQDNFEIDAKAFQRKRRIGISLVNTKRKVDGDEVKNEEGVKKVEYPGFKSGGILFGDEKKEEIEVKVDDDDLVKEINETKNTLEEKLKFLSEGHPPALPVQVMIIQMETLFTAMCEDSLKPSYLKNWLNSTVEDLTKLEKEAAPSGWLLQWDRSHKRYYYHNQATGDSQWDFPEADAIRTEEAMDISMTPPHDDQSTNRSLESESQAEPPPPPSIRNKSISPPPPPIISKIDNVDQPLPPGVEEDKEKAPNGKDGSFSSELSSFYSDIAAIESNLPQPVTIKTNPDEIKPEEIISQPPKKKKKVKVSSGLAMKKKGVSQMVEKWKNLQKNYD